MLPARRVGFGAMDRSLQAVLIGTFTLRFSTGLTGTMLAVYLGEFALHHPETGTVGVHRGRGAGHISWMGRGGPASSQACRPVSAAGPIASSTSPSGTSHRTTR